MKYSPLIRTILIGVPVLVVAAAALALVQSYENGRGRTASSQSVPDDAPAAWETLRQRAEERLSGGDEAAAREILDELLAFARQHRGTHESVLAFFNHGQLAIALGELELAEQSLRTARSAAADPQMLAAINQALSQVAVRPGIEPPDFAVDSLDGKAVSPRDYRGKVLLIDFWATWCAPCIAELPNVQRVFEKYHDEGLEIVSVSLDRTPDALKAFLQRQSMSWTHIFNAASPRGEDPASIYGVTAIPTMILVGRDGRVVAINMRGPQLEQEVKRAVSQEAPPAGADRSPPEDEVGDTDAMPNIGRSRGPQNPGLGVLDRKAPSWRVDDWFNLPEARTSLDVDDFRGKVVYLYGFQSWCPGCHSHGFPTLQELTRRFEGVADVAFVAVQTTFEGFSTNTADSAVRTVTRYALDIPIGHSGREGERSRLMSDYRTGGTPWTIIIDREGVVRFNDFHITPEQAEQLINHLRRGGNAEAPQHETSTGDIETLPAHRGGQDVIGVRLPESEFDRWLTRSGSESPRATALSMVDR